MIKIKNARKALAIVVMFAMMLMFNSGALLNIATAASLTNASVTLGDSTPSATATSTVSFTIGTALYNDVSTPDYMRVVFPAEFSGLDQSHVLCPNNATASTTGNVLDCVVTEDIATSSVLRTITVGYLTNPAAEDNEGYTIVISTFSGSGTVKESSQVKVYIIAGVSVSATVNASLTFSIVTVSQGTVVNGIPTTGPSTSTTIPFGTLSVSASSTIAQQLEVATNATQGYRVTVEETAELSNAAGAIIDKFKDGVDLGSPNVWSAPSNDIEDAKTWGHMGITSDDSDLAVSFAGTKYIGLSTSSPVTVLSHNGPANGSTQDKGMAKVAYSTQITALQEAGDYNTTIKYIVTPTY